MEGEMVVGGGDGKEGGGVLVRYIGRLHLYMCMVCLL